MESKLAPPDIKARLKQVGRNADKLLMIEYFMRQYPSLLEGLTKLVEQYEAERKLQGSSERSAKWGPCDKPNRANLTG